MKRKTKTLVLKVFVLLYIHSSVAGLIMLAPPGSTSFKDSIVEDSGRADLLESRALRRFMEYLPEGIVNAIEIKGYIESKTIFKGCEQDNPTITIVFKKDLADIISYKTFVPGRRVVKMVYQYNREFESFTALWGAEKYDEQEIFLPRQAMGGLLYQTAYSRTDLKKKRLEALEGGISLGQASDIINHYNHIGFDGARTVVIAKARKAEKKRILREMAYANHGAGFLGKTLCLVRGFGVSSKEMSDIAEWVYLASIESYIQKNPGQKNEIAVLEEIRQNSDWNRLFKCGIDTGVNLIPSSGLLLEKSHSFGLGFELQAVTAVAVLEKIFSSPELMNFVFGAHKKKMKVLIGSYGETGSAMYRAFAQTKLAKYELSMTGLFNQTGGIYSETGISRVVFEQLRRSAVADKIFNFRKMRDLPGMTVASKDSTLKKPADIFINATRYDFLNAQNLQVLADAGVKLVIDFSVTPITEDMIDVFRQNGMIFIPSTLTRGIYNLIAHEEIVHGYYGVPEDENVSKSLVYHVVDEISGRLAVALDDVFSRLLESSFEMSISRSIYERVGKILNNKSVISRNLKTAGFGELADYLYSINSEDKLKYYAVELDRFVDMHLNELSTCSRNALKRVARLMKAGVRFGISYEHSIILEAEKMEKYAGRTDMDFAGMLESVLDMDRIASARNISYIRVSNPYVINKLIGKISGIPDMSIKRDANPAVRANCVRALGYMDRESASEKVLDNVYECLLTALSDPSSNVRYSAIWALNGLGLDEKDVYARIYSLKNKIKEVNSILIHKGYGSIEKGMPDDHGLIQNCNLELGGLYHKIAALYDYLRRFEEARESYNESIACYKASNFGGIAVLETQLRIGRIFIQEGKYAEGIRELLHLVDPYQVENMFVTGSASLSESEKMELMINARFAGELQVGYLRQIALYEYFNVYREHNLFPDAYDMSESLNKILRDAAFKEFEDGNFNARGSATERLRRIKSMESIIPDYIEDPYYKLLAVYGSKLYRGGEDSTNNIKNVLNYLIAKRLLTDSGGNLLASDDMLKLIRGLGQNKKAEPTIPRLAKNEVNEMVSMLKILGIITRYRPVSDETIFGYKIRNSSL